jgi:hypothetical protein
MVVGAWLDSYVVVLMTGLMHQIHCSAMAVDSVVMHASSWFVCGICVLEGMGAAAVQEVKVCFVPVSVVCTCVKSSLQDQSHASIPTWGFAESLCVSLQQAGVHECVGYSVLDPAQLLPDSQCTGSTPAGRNRNSTMIGF